MTKSPPGDGGVLRKDDSEDFGDRAIVREGIPPLRRLSNIAATELRRIWLRQASTGHRLPAERTWYAGRDVPESPWDHGVDAGIAAISSRPKTYADGARLSERLAEREAG